MSRVLVVGGRDRLRFLHAVTTQDVASLKPGEGAYGALTDDRGRPVSDFFLYVMPGAVLLEAPFYAADALHAALERLIIADDVVLAPAAGADRIYEADSAAELRALLEPDRLAAGQFVPPIEALDARTPGVGWSGGDRPPDESELARYPMVHQAVLRASRFGGLGALLWPAESDTSCTGRFHPLVIAAYDALAIRAFRPGPAEFAEARVWNELDRMDAVSFTKGCFMGQEILNRVHAQGQLQRKLVTLALDGPAPETADAWKGVELVAPDGRPAGVITRAAEDVAFAFVRRLYWEPGSRLTARIPGGRDEALGVTVRPRTTVEVP